MKNQFLYISLLGLFACNQGSENAKSDPSDTTKQIFIAETGPSIKDYYIPDQSNYNTAKYYGVNGELSSHTYYVDNGDGTYNIIEEQFMYGSTQEHLITVQFTDNEVKIIKSRIINVGITDVSKTYEPPEILFKMPEGSHIATWIDPISTEPKTVYESFWTTVKVGQENRKAIAVVEKGLAPHVELIRYYVQGIGLMNTNIKKGDGVVRRFVDFKGLSYDKDAKNFKGTKY